MRLVSLIDLKTFLEKTDSTHDDLLGLIIDRVSLTIENYLNRNLLKAARTAYFDAGRIYYYLPAFPIDETATLTVTHVTTVQTKDTDYFVRANDGVIEFQKSSIPSYTDPKELCIVWTGGYANAGEGNSECLEIPVDIQDAASRQCAYNFRRRKDIGITSVSMPDGSVTKSPISTVLLPEVKDILRNYRKPAGIY